MQLILNTRFSPHMLSCFIDDLPLLGFLDTVMFPVFLLINLDLTDSRKWAANVPKGVFLGRGVVKLLVG